MTTTNKPEDTPSPKVGTVIEVFWAPDETFYTGKVTKVLKNKHEVRYNDGDVEKLDLAKERWRLKEGGPTENGLHEDEGNTVKENPKEPPIVGATIQVYWPDDKEYYEGTIKSYSKKTKKHQIDYDDGQSEKLVLEKESWRYPPAGDAAADDEDEDEDEEEEEEEEDVREVKVGDSVEVYWPQDEVYYPGKIDGYNAKTGTHSIKYDDDEEEVVVLKNEKWRFSEPTNDTGASEGNNIVPKKRGRPASVTKASAKPLGGKSTKKKRT